MAQTITELQPIDYNGETYHPWMVGETIQDRAALIGRHLGKLLAGERVRTVFVHRGGETFARLVIPHLVEGPAEVTEDSVWVTTYKGEESGEPEWKKYLDTPLDPDEVVVLIDDIADSYQTFEVVTDELRQNNPDQRVITVAMLNRPDARPGREHLEPDYVGALIRDKEAWAIGMGLGIDGPNGENFFADLPDIYGKEVDGRVPQPPVFPELPPLPTAAV